jgi:hypothetical protein
MKYVVVGSAILATMAAASSAMGQSFNIDFGTNVASPTPPNTFGGAANSVGTWNQINATTSNLAVPLNGLNGAALPGVTITQVGDGDASFFSNNAATTGDFQNLLDDILDLGSSATPADNFLVAGLANGTYDVYTYAWAPDSNTFITSVDVNATGAQAVGGVFSGSFQQGITHALHTVTINNGQINIALDSTTGFGSFNGLQVVLVPGPGAMAIFGLAGLISRRSRDRRRS